MMGSDVSFFENIPSTITLLSGDYEVLKKVRFTRSIKHTLKTLARMCKERLEKFKVTHAKACEEMDNSYRVLFELVENSRCAMRQVNEDILSTVKKSTEELLDYLKHVYSNLREDSDEAPEIVFHPKELHDDTKQEQKYELKESLLTEEGVESILTKLEGMIECQN